MVTLDIDFSQNLGNLPRLQRYTNELRNTRVGGLDEQLLKDIDITLERTYYILSTVCPNEGDYRWTNPYTDRFYGNDEILDNIIYNHGAQPLINISGIPKWLNGKDPSNIEFPPLDYNKWKILIRDVLTHLKTKYPTIVYISLLNEVMDDWTWYNTLYYHTSKVVDEVNNNLPAGVPRIKLGGKEDYSLYNGWFSTYQSFLKYVQDNNLNLDFLTWHIYTEMSYFGLNPGDINSSAVSTKKMKQWLDEKGMNAELIISEWCVSGQNLELYGPDGNLSPLNQNINASWTIAGWSTLMETGINVIPILFSNMDYGQPNQSIMVPDYAYLTHADIHAIPPKLTKLPYPDGAFLSKYNVYKMLKMSKNYLVSAKNVNNIYIIASKDNSGIAVILTNYQNSSQSVTINLHLPSTFQTGNIHYEQYLVDNTHSYFDWLVASNPNRVSKPLEKVDDSNLLPTSSLNKVYNMDQYATILIVMTPESQPCQLPQFDIQVTQ